MHVHSTKVSYLFIKILYFINSIYLYIWLGSGKGINYECKETWYDAK
jgi:hypothetical protein